MPKSVRPFGRFQGDHLGNVSGVFASAGISTRGVAIERIEAFFTVLNSIAVQLRRLRADERGTVAATMGILMIPLVGFLAIGFEVSNWYLITRGMQNAADAATIAAAFNNGANYDVEARAVASQYGFTNGVNNITVAVTNNAACPGGGNNCYSVSISGFTPLLLSQVVGFQGNGNINGALQKQLSALRSANKTPRLFACWRLRPAALPRVSAPTGRRSPTCRAAAPCQTLLLSATDTISDSMSVSRSDPTTGVATSRCIPARCRTLIRTRSQRIFPPTPVAATPRKNRESTAAQLCPRATCGRTI